MSTILGLVMFAAYIFSRLAGSEDPNVFLAAMIGCLVAGGLEHIGIGLGRIGNAISRK